MLKYEGSKYVVVDVVVIVRSVRGKMESYVWPQTAYRPSPASADEVALAIFACARHPDSPSTSINNISSAWDVEGGDGASWETYHISGARYRQPGHTRSSPVLHLPTV